MKDYKDPKNLRNWTRTDRKREEIQVKNFIEKKSLIRPSIHRKKLKRLSSLAKIARQSSEFKI
jgi:hypothetical protein